MTRREKLLLATAPIAMVAGAFCIGPALRWFYRVPDWHPEPDAVEVNSSADSDRGRLVVVVPYRGYYPGSLQLRIHGGDLCDERAMPVPREHIRAYIEQLCRINPERTIVLLAAPQEKFGDIVAVANEARSGKYGRFVVMFDAPIRDWQRSKVAEQVAPDQRP